VKFKLILLGSCTLPFAIIAPKLRVTSRSPVFRKSTSRVEPVDERDICRPSTACPHRGVSNVGRDAPAEERIIKKDIDAVRIRDVLFM
jgi:hypothetical protein